MALKDKGCHIRYAVSYYQRQEWRKETERKIKGRKNGPNPLSFSGPARYMM